MNGAKSRTKPSQGGGVGKLKLESNHVTVSVAERHIAIVTLDRPAKRNAITPAMTQDLAAAAEAIEKDDEIRVVIIMGNSEIFCSGGDLEVIGAGRGSELRTADGGFAGIAELPRSKPWVAAVGGAALAGGFELVLSCDLVIAATNGRLGLPEVKHGLVATGGGVYRLPCAIPRHVALDMIATGEPISARRAYELGLVSDVVVPGQLLERALRKARTIAGHSTEAVRESLAIARTATSRSDKAVRSAVAGARRRVLPSTGC